MLNVASVFIGVFALEAKAELHEPWPNWTMAIKDTVVNTMETALRLYESIVSPFQEKQKLH